MLRTNSSSRRGNRCRRLACERLENRTLLAADTTLEPNAFSALTAEPEAAAVPGYLTIDEAATFLRRQTVSGATIITHGFQLTEDGDSLMPLAQAIKARTDSENGPTKTAWLLDYDVVEANGAYVGLFDANQSTLSVEGEGEVILLFDWARESNELSSGWGAAAADALFSLVIDLGLVIPTTHTAVPMHWIGHSFGTAVTSDTVERLAAFAIPVDQVTYLDPHDFDQTGLPVDHDQRLFDLGRPDGYGATTWNNVAFTDVWYQTDAILPIPDGRPIPGAYNVLINELVNSLNPHSEVWDVFYRSTVENSDATTGYAFSRIGGTARPSLNDDTNQQYRFFSEPPTAQDHVHTPPTLTDGGRPITPEEANFRRWEPDWNPLHPANGDFEHSGSSLGSVVPGWTNHGGGGDGHVDCDGSCYLELDFGNTSRVHNRFYVPAEALTLYFDLWRTDESDNDQFIVRIGEQTVGTYSLSSTDATFTTQVIALPPELRDRSQVLEFSLVAGGFSIDSEVRIDNIRMGAWQNLIQPADVSGDGLVVPGDVLLVINEINFPKIRQSNGQLPTTGRLALGPPYFDVNGDEVVGPIDVLIVINHINANSAEGESAELIAWEFLSRHSSGQCLDTSVDRVLPKKRHPTGKAATGIQRQ